MKSAIINSIFIAFAFVCKMHKRNGIPIIRRNVNKSSDKTYKASIYLQMKTVNLTALRINSRHIIKINSKIFMRNFMDAICLLHAILLRFRFQSNSHRSLMISTEFVYIHNSPNRKHRPIPLSNQVLFAIFNCR